MANWQEFGPRSDGAFRIAVVGYQIDLSYPFQIFSAAVHEQFKDGVVVPLDVPKVEFEECIRHLHAAGFAGVSVANPHKVDAARIAERFWVARFSLGVANALKFDGGIFAQNTEVPAISECVRGIDPSTALVMGTGHAARSVVAGLLQMDWKIKVWNRNANKTRILQTLLGRYGTLEIAANPDPSGCRLVVNATPLGAKPGEQPPLQWARILPRTVCFDLVFRRVPTEFLRAASMRGLKTIDGRELLVEQCALTFEWISGKPAPRPAMRTAAGLKAGPGIQANPN